MHHSPEKCQDTISIFLLPLFLPLCNLCLILTALDQYSLLSSLFKAYTAASEKHPVCAINIY